MLLDSFNFVVSGESSKLEVFPNIDKFNLRSQKYIVISAAKSEQWKMGKMPINEYATLADNIVENFGKNIVFVGSKSETIYIDSIIEQTSNKSMMTNLAGQSSVEDLSLILNYSQFIVANDNGIAHLSGYLNLKVLVLFMFSDPKVYEWDTQNYEYIFEGIAPCMPCVSLNKHPIDNYPVLCPNNLKCNDSISAEKIIKKLTQLQWLK